MINLIEPTNTFSFSILTLVSAVLRVGQRLLEPVRRRLGRDDHLRHAAAAQAAPARAGDVAGSGGREHRPEVGRRRQRMHHQLPELQRG